MMTELLEDHTEQLMELMAHESPHIRSRAQIIMLSLDGQSIPEIAAETGLSERTVLKWTKAWEADGMGIFPVDEADHPTPEAPQIVADAAEIPLTPEPVEVDEAPTLMLPTKVGTAGILATDSLLEAARKTLHFQLQEMLTYQAQIDGDNSIEGVHKMRVATRRIRSAYRLFDGVLTSDYYGKFPKRFKQTALLLGEVRDLDVYRHKTEVYVNSTTHADTAGLSPLFEAIDEHRISALVELQAWFADERFNKFLTRFQTVVASPTPDTIADVVAPQASQVNHVLPRLIYTQWEAVQRFDGVIEHANATTLHALRIEFKRLRYTLEFFEEVLGPSLKLVIKEIKQMQDHLGDLNDAEVAGALIRDLQKGLKKADRAAVEEYRAAREVEAAKLKASAPTAWAKFHRPEVHEALAMAIAVL